MPRLNRERLPGPASIIRPARRIRKADKVELLGRLPLFESTSKKELGAISDAMVEAVRPAGSLLTREGKDGGLLFVIVDGEAEAVAGDGTVIGRLGQGDVVGELSLIDGRPRSASVRAVTDVRILQLASDDFYRLVQTSPRFVRNLLRALSQRVRRAEKLTL
jgi:CRP/FNR family cyclic AMP-dependent transcriptional regulator